MSAYTQAHQTLAADLRDALMSSPTRVVMSPGFPHQKLSAAEIILDDFSGVSGEESLNELLRIVGMVAAGQDAHLRAAAWIASASTRHANFHADDLVESWRAAA